MKSYFINYYIVIIYIEINNFCVGRCYKKDTLLRIRGIMKSIQKRILITGGNGLLGIKLLRQAAVEYHITAIDLHDNPVVEISDMDYFKVDITDEENIRTIIKKIKPDCIINTAALTDVDACEDRKELAWNVNVNGTKNIAACCKELGIKLIHISSDYVFDGNNGPYTEDDEIKPINYYGYTKFESEKIVQEFLSDYAICRTTVLYGYESMVRMNFVTWLIQMLKDKKKLKIVTDQVGTPTLADDLSSALLTILKKNGRGIYNTVGSELIDRYSFAIKVASVFNQDVSLIEKTTSDLLKQKAERPLKAGLKIDKIKSELGVNFSSVDEGLIRLKKQILYST